MYIICSRSCRGSWNYIPTESLVLFSVPLLWKQLYGWSRYRVVAEQGLEEEGKGWLKCFLRKREIFSGPYHDLTTVQHTSTVLSFSEQSNQTILWFFFNHKYHMSLSQIIITKKIKPTKGKRLHLPATKSTKPPASAPPPIETRYPCAYPSSLHSGNSLHSPFQEFCFCITPYNYCVCVFFSHDQFLFIDLFPLWCRISHLDVNTWALP